MLFEEDDLMIQEPDHHVNKSSGRIDKTKADLIKDILKLKNAETIHG